MSDKTTRRTPLEQANEASDLAREAFASGDIVTGIAAIRLAAQLIEFARIQERIASTDMEPYT